MSEHDNATTPDDVPEERIDATIELEETELLWPQTTRCFVEIRNRTSDVISALNTRYERGSCPLRLTEVATGKTTEHARPRHPGDFPPAIELFPGDRWQDVYGLAHRLSFPRAGEFDLAARFEWAGGSTVSPPVRVGVRPATPLSFSGSGMGIPYCAWVNEVGRKKADLWLAFVNIAEVRFESSTRLCEVPADTVPVISVTADTLSTHQYTSWIRDRSLFYVTHSYGKVGGPHEVDLGKSGHHLVPHLLECPPEDGRPGCALGLLWRPGKSAWSMRVVSLGDPPIVSDPVLAHGAPPVWACSAFTSDGCGHTFFLLPETSPGGKPGLRLCSTSWSADRLPSAPTPLAYWPGRLVQADLCLRNDDAVFGAAIVDRGDTVARYAIRSWSLAPEQPPTEEPPVPLGWPVEEAEIERAFLRATGSGDRLALIQRAGDGRWFTGDAEGRVNPVPERLTGISLPADALFLVNSVPALLYTEPGCGLRVSPLV